MILVDQLTVRPHFDIYSHCVSSSRFDKDHSNYFSTLGSTVRTDLWLTQSHVYHPGCPPWACSEPWSWALIFSYFLCKLASPFQVSERLHFTFSWSQFILLSVALLAWSARRCFLPPSLLRHTGPAAAPGVQLVIVQAAGCPSQLLCSISLWFSLILHD